MSVDSAASGGDMVNKIVRCDREALCMLKREPYSMLQSHQIRTRECGDDRVTLAFDGLAAAF